MAGEGGEEEEEEGMEQEARRRIVAFKLSREIFPFFAGHGKRERERQDKEKCAREDKKKEEHSAGG